MLLFLSVNPFSENSLFSFLAQAIECEMDGEEKADFEPEDEFFVFAVHTPNYSLLYTDIQFTCHSSQLPEGLIFEIVPPPPKA